MLDILQHPQNITGVCRSPTKPSVTATWYLNSLFSFLCTLQLFIYLLFFCCCSCHTDLNSVQNNTELYMLKHLTYPANSTADEASY